MNLKSFPHDMSVREIDAAIASGQFMPMCNDCRKAKPHRYMRLYPLPPRKCQCGSRADLAVITPVKDAIKEAAQ